MARGPAARGFPPGLRGGIIAEPMGAQIREQAAVGRSTARRHAPLFVGIALFACQRIPPAVTLDQYRVADVQVPPDIDRLDPSGLCRDGDRLLTVSDKVDTIFALEPAGDAVLRAVPMLGLSQRRDGSDLEGITSLDGRLVAASEHDTGVLFADGRSVALDLDAVPGLARAMAGGKNDGLEAIAAGRDAAGRWRLFVAKERAPRVIVELDVATLRPIRFEVLAAAGYPRTVDVGGKRFDVAADVSGLCIDGGHLYALSKNTWTVLKLDPDTLAVLAEARFPKVDHEYFATDEPFGMAEGLVVAGHEIVVVFDNNDMPRRRDARDRRPIVVTFERPAGF